MNKRRRMAIVKHRRKGKKLEEKVKAEKALGEK